MNIESEEVKKGAVAVLVFLLATFVGTQVGSGEQVQEPGVEINSSNSIVQPVLNSSLQVLLEDSANASFYLDRDGDGSAEKKLELVKEGDVHRRSLLLDTRRGLFRATVTYVDDPNVTDDAEMSFESLRLLR